MTDLDAMTTVSPSDEEPVGGRVSSEAAVPWWPSNRRRTAFIVLAMLGAIALVLLQWAIRWSDSDLRASTSGLIPLAAALGLTAMAFMAGSARWGLRLVLAGAGALLSFVWLIVRLWEIPLEPRVLLDVYAISAGLLLFGSWAAGRSDARAWVVAMAAALVMWLLSLSALLSVLFEPILDPSGRIVASFASLIFFGWSTWAVMLLTRISTDFDRTLRIDWSQRFSGLALIVIVGVGATAYGLWYGYIVEPSAVEPSVDVAFALEPHGTDADLSRFAYTLEVTNPTEHTIRLLASPFVAASGIVEPRANPRTAAELRCDISRQAAPGSGNGGQCTTALDVLFPGIRDEPVADEVWSTTGSDEVPRLWNSAVSRVRLVQHMTGQFWTGPVRIQPGSTARVRGVLIVPQPADYLAIRSELMYGLDDRWQRLAVTPTTAGGSGAAEPTAGTARPTERPRPGGDAVAVAEADLAGQTSPEGCGTLQEVAEFRLIPIDPVSGLLHAWEPHRARVGWKPGVTLVPAQACRWTRGGFVEMDTEEARRLGLARSVIWDDFVFDASPAVAVVKGG